MIALCCELNRDKKILKNYWLFTFLVVETDVFSIVHRCFTEISIRSIMTCLAIHTTSHMTWANTDLRCVVLSYSNTMNCRLLPYLWDAENCWIVSLLLFYYCYLTKRLHWFCVFSVMAKLKILLGHCSCSVFKRGNHNSVRIKESKWLSVMSLIIVLTNKNNFRLVC